MLPFDRQYLLTGTKPPVYLVSINCVIPRFDITSALNLLGGGCVIILSEVKWCLASHYCTDRAFPEKKMAEPSSAAFNVAELEILKTVRHADSLSHLAFGR